MSKQQECEGKRAYPSKRQAREALKCTKASKRDVYEKDRYLHYYLCPHCHQYHVGHQSKLPIGKLSLKDLKKPELTPKQLLPPELR